MDSSDIGHYPGDVLRRPPPILVYLLLAVAMTWPLALNLGSAMVGFGGVDGADTATLGGLVADWLRHPAFSGGQAISRDIYFPVGYPIFGLLPNLLDHLSAAPLAWILPFPLCDNLWWLAVLAASGGAAHRLGRRLGGSEGAGYLAGVVFLVSEPLAREANLHHAPQAMVFWAPLYLDAVLALRAAPTRQRALEAGLWLAGAALSYWYMGLFLALGSAPLLLLDRASTPDRPGRPPLALLAALGATTGVVCAPWLAPLLLGWAAGPVTSGGHVPPPLGLPGSYDAVPADLRFVAQHGADLLFWLRRTPIDTASRVSLVALVAAAIGGRTLDRGARRGLWAMAAISAGMLLGPYLRWDEDLVLAHGAAISLPFRWLGRLHPVLARLTWPERWGMLLPVALAALAARAPRPGVWAVAVALEGFLVSGNLPVRATTLRFETCWAALSQTSGAVLELPLAREALRAARVGVHRRFHRRPLVNPILLPPGARPPDAWRTWAESSPLIAYLHALEEGKWPDDPGAEAVRSLRAAGVTALALDAEPGALLTPAGLSRYRTALTRHLGPPVDLGCALVWWLDPTVPPPAGLADGEAWREAASAWKAANPDPPLNARMAPRGPSVAAGDLPD